MIHGLETQGSLAAVCGGAGIGRRLPGKLFTGLLRDLERAGAADSSALYEDPECQDAEADGQDQRIVVERAGQHEEQQQGDGRHRQRDDEIPAGSPVLFSLFSVMASRYHGALTLPTASRDSIREVGADVLFAGGLRRSAASPRISRGIIPMETMEWSEGT